MPLSHYGVLCGQVVGSRPEGGVDTPHFQIHVRAAGEDFRVAVNVLSQQSPSELLFVADEAFRHPMLTSVAALAEGFTPVPSTSGGLALDFIRGNLFDRSLLRPMPATAPGPDNDLADELDHYTSRAQASGTARVYAFGERWGPETGVADKVFGFVPGNGVHDIHMNQGNNGSFTRDDGVWQDGGLLFHFPEADQWVAVFLAFQSQTWHTDDTTGHALAVAPGPVPGPTDPDRRLRVVAALVNAVGPAPERETVTLLNPGVAGIDLGGWALVDGLGGRLQLNPQPLPPGETVRLPVTGPVQLGNRGGTLTLLDPGGLKVDGVSWTADEARTEGITLVF